MATESDYYGILHVRPDAPTEIIRASYRTLMHALRIHPDRGGDNEQAARINQAYQVLSDPTRRAEYDREFNNGRADPVSYADEPGTQKCLFCAKAITGKLMEAADAVCSRCGSPLQRATRHRLERSTRRMLRRMDRKLAVRVFVDWNGADPIDGMMQNLSLNGLLFQSRHEFEANQLIKIDTELCKALGRVTHCRPASGRDFSTGIEFVTILFKNTRGTFVSEHV